MGTVCKANGHRARNTRKRIHPRWIIIYIIVFNHADAEYPHITISTATVDCRKLLLLLTLEFVLYRIMFYPSASHGSAPPFRQGRHKSLLLPLGAVKIPPTQSIPVSIKKEPIRALFNLVYSIILRWFQQVLPQREQLQLLQRALSYYMH